ncbi:MlaD family protein [Rhodovulum euryhalinum]|uniref:Phospholipid/cholesterol/gamma-HCH transport system substrate-binding protein n=1 Tax=Rhodovulum euryhalinum TaxID=35805 RepID=A0A4V2S9V2_9RHOB|nr:MlaD family protein [Rhodovulum euryhalinum]TCO69130.1 phospholipid/cholesterol/gamma-HCH transport system substrate-binding protein [Rhodovulum euryhalinum]
METRARFVLMGLFTIVGFLAALGFVLWLAKVQIDRTYAQYDILFGTVAGLSQTGAVRYNGVDVGKVLTIALDRDDPALVRVRIEVLASTPVRTDTIATLAAQGVTGVAFIALEGGSADADAIAPVPPADVPVIRSERSVVQDLMVTGPNLLAEATALISDVRGFAAPANRDAIAGILSNLQDATGRIDALATRAVRTLSRVDAVLDATEAGLTSTNGLLEGDVPALVADLRAVAGSTGAAMDGIRGATQGALPRLSAQIGTLIQDASGVLARFDALARQIGSDPGRFLLGNETPEYRRSE